MKIVLKKRALELVLSLLIVTYFVTLLLPLLPGGSGQENLVSNQSTVNVTVNITNSAPEVRFVSIDSPIDLTAYSQKLVHCNASVFDWDQDDLIVNATLYQDSIADTGTPDDNNYHYTNASCFNTSAPNQLYVNYSCAFLVEYYANNDTTWVCNVTAIDDDGATHSNMSAFTSLNPLVALYIPGYIDYGDLAVGDISLDRPANLTNAGNRDINITVEGYASWRGDNLSMNCSYGQIPIEYQRYNITPGMQWADQMYWITNSSELIPGMEVVQRTNEANESLNITYFKLQVPPGAGGICTGKLLFQASESG